MARGNFRRWSLAYFPLFCLFAFSDLAAQTTPPKIQIEHAPVSTFQHGEKVEIKAKVLSDQKIEWMRIFFRYEGLSEFQVRNMDDAGEAGFVHMMDTGEISGLAFEYFLAAKVQSDIISFPSSAPDIPLKVTGTSAAPMPEIPQSLTPPQQVKEEFRLPVSLSGSSEKTLMESKTLGQDIAYPISANGNLRIFRSSQFNTVSISLDSNLPFTLNPAEGSPPINLSNLMLAVSLPRHTFRAGDINVNESEYSINAGGRRGVEYIFNNQKLYFHLYDVSSQQPQGLRGFGIPNAAMSLLGGTIGVTVVPNVFSIKAIYVTGKDDPTQAGNTGFSSFIQGREGTVIAIAQDASLFENKMTIRSEYAHSQHRTLDTEAETVGGNAWNVRSDLALGFLNLGAGYKFIGKEFNPIGHQYFAKDRQGFAFNADLNLGKVTINGLWTSEGNNVESDSDAPQSDTSDQSVGLTWIPAGVVSFNLRYRRGRQEASQLAWQSALQMSLTQEYAAGMNLQFGALGNLSVSVSSMDQTSESDPAAGQRNFMVNVGAGFRAGEILSLNPTFSLSIAKNLATLNSTTSYNSQVFAEISFYPKVASLSVVGGFARQELSPTITNDQWNVTGNLNIYLQELIKIGQVAFTLAGSFRRSIVGDVGDSFFDLRAKLNVSF